MTYTADMLTPEQAHVLTLFGSEMDEFKVTLKCIWDAQVGRDARAIQDDDLPESVPEPDGESEEEDDCKPGLRPSSKFCISTGHPRTAVTPLEGAALYFYYR